MEVVEISLTLGGSTPTGKNYQNARADVQQRIRLTASEASTIAATVPIFAALRNRTKIMLDEALADAKGILLHGLEGGDERLSPEEVVGLLKKMQSLAEDEVKNE